MQPESRGQSRNEQEAELQCERDRPRVGGSDRIRTENCDILTGDIVYDTQIVCVDGFADRTTVIGGGSIVILKG